MYFSPILEKIRFEIMKYLSYSQISTLLINDNYMNKTYVSCPPQYINKIGEVCKSLGKDSLIFVCRKLLGFWQTGALNLQAKIDLISD